MSKWEDMFQSLRLSVGGGLNSAIDKVAQADNTVTICIGLGGTGRDALRMFKKTVYERVEQDNFDRRDYEEPRYNRIRFLAIDSDRSCVASYSPELDLTDDFFDIGIPYFQAELKDRQQFYNKGYLNWFSKKIHIPDANTMILGRQFGRYRICKYAYDLYNKLTDMIHSSTRGLSTRFELNINVIAGLGGDIGGGCFIDVCYIVQQVLCDMGLKSNSLVSGFFFLPEVNLSNPNLPKGGPEEISIKRNSFAALKELDYLMNIPKNGDVFEQKYSEDFEIKQAIPPVDMPYLLTAPLENGKEIPNGYSYAMNVVSDFILNTVVKNVEADPIHSSIPNLIKVMYSNLSGLVRHTHKTYGANYVYNILGTSCATVPYKKIGTYLAIRFFESIRYIQKTRPTKRDVEKFCQNIGLDFCRLDMRVRRGTRGLAVDPARFDTKALKTATVGTISAPLAEFCEKWKDDYERRVEANIAILGRSLDEYEVNSNPESIIGQIYKELICIIKNPDLGPYFAAYMINDAQNCTLSSVIAGIRTEVENKRNHAQGQAAYRDRCENEAQAEFRSASLDMFDRRKKNYVFMVQERYKNEVEINTYNAFLGLIDKIKKHVEKIETEYFKKLTGITDKLIETFEDNASYFKTHGMGDEMYTWSIIDIEDIKDGLDEVVAKLTKKTDNDVLVAPYLVEKFDALMLSNHDKWLDENETKIAELISSFIRTEFKDAMSKSMKQYLQEKYNATGHDLIKCISDEVIKNGLVAKGAPVFHCDSSMINLTEKSNDYIETAVLIVPNDEEDFSEAAKEYKRNSGKRIGIAENVLTDRIFMLNVFSGIPMYAYKELQSLETIYYTHLSAGMHMYESEEKNWIDLPSPMPATFESSFYTRADQSKIDATIALYDRALKEGLISEDRTALCATIYSTPDNSMSQIFDSVLPANAIDVIESIVSLETEEKQDKKIYDVIRANIWSLDKATTNMALLKINDYISAYKESYKDTAKLVAYNITEKNGKYPNGFDSSIRDDFVMKPVFVKIVKTEIDKFNKLKSIYRVLNAILAKKTENEDLTENFIKALLHSVIYKYRSNYKFNFEKNGEKEEIILTTNFEEYDQIPVYRAFLSYKELDAEISEQIAEKTRDAAKNVTDEMYENTKAFWEFYKSVYQEFKDEASIYGFVDIDLIIAFLDKLYDELNSFIRENK